MAEVTTSRGVVILIDDADLPLVAPHRWRLVGSTWTDRLGARKRKLYAAARIDGKQAMLMHRYLLGARPGEQIDHINGEALDNRRANLRRCVVAENARNAFQTLGKAKYRGLSWHRGRWMVRLRGNGLNRFLGYFDDEEEAGRAYDAAAKDAYGEFAFLNFPE